MLHKQIFFWLCSQIFAKIKQQDYSILVNIHACQINLSLIIKIQIFFLKTCLLSTILITLIKIFFFTYFILWLVFSLKKNATKNCLHIFEYNFNKIPTHTVIKIYMPIVVEFWNGGYKIRKFFALNWKQTDR